MSTEEFIQYYDRIYLGSAEYFEVHRDRFIESWRFLADHGLAESRTVMDVGGIGPLSAFMRDRYQRAVRETKSDLRYTLDIESNSCELVICTETIEHIKDRESSSISDLESFNFSGIDSLLLELNRICTPSGAVFISTPNANSFITLHKWLHGEALFIDPNHVRELSVADLRAHALTAGFEVQTLGTVNTWRRQFGHAVEALSKALAALHGSVGVARGCNIFALLRKRNREPR